jgi:hypothetical protein
MFPRIFPHCGTQAVTIYYYYTTTTIAAAAATATTIATTTTTTAAVLTLAMGQLRWLVCSADSGECCL